MFKSLSFDVCLTRFAHTMSKYALGTYRIVWEDRPDKVAESLGLRRISMVS